MLKDKMVIITGGAGLLDKGFIESVIKNQGIADIDMVKVAEVKSSLSSKQQEKN